MNYNKQDWLRKIDDAISAKASVTHKTNKGNEVTLTMNVTVGFIAYHLADKRANWNTGEGVWCSQLKLAEQFNMSRQTVSNAFTLLSELGFLNRDITKEKPGGTNYYDLSIPQGVFSQDMVVSTEDRGCLDNGQGMSSHETQTTNRTTKTKTKLKTKSNASEARRAPRAVDLPYSSIEDVFPIDQKNDGSIEDNNEAGGVLREDRVPAHVAEFRKVAGGFNLGDVMAKNAKSQRKPEYETVDVDW